MKKKKVGTRVKITVTLISVLAFILVMHFLYMRYYKTKVAEITHRRITSYINTELQYETETYDKELGELNELLSLSFISDSDKGHIYERMAQIYKFKGDTLNFYHTMGNALYYLEKSDNVSVAVNIYEDIANYYVADNNFPQAEKIIKKAYEVSSPEDIPDIQVKSYAYRMQAMISRHNGELSKAREFINISTSLANEDPDAYWYGSYIAINEAVLAGIAYDEGNYDEAHLLLDRNKDSEYFSMPSYADILTRDFSLQYYDTACKMAAKDGNTEKLKEYLSRCKTSSEQFGFYKKELSIILDLLENDYALPSDLQKELTDRTMHIYSTITQIQSDEYAAMINSPLESGINEQKQIYEQQVAHAFKLRICMIVVMISLVVVYIIATVVFRAVTDALTGIGNRRALEQALYLTGILHSNIHVVMMDVDNFKKVNDNYGHDQGDVVLKRIGTLLKNLRSRNIRCFRYGGEEFVLLIKRLDKNAVLRMMESIRMDVAWQTWDFPGPVTVSIGVTAGPPKKETVRLADENMYHSKTHGKNAVSYDLNGEKIILGKRDDIIGAEDSSRS